MHKLFLHLPEISQPKKQLSQEYYSGDYMSEKRILFERKEL
jgi:hypothetical protein